MPATRTSRCPRCSGCLTATHMLLGTYPLDSAGFWQKRTADFREDLLIACAVCGHAPAGRVQRCGDRLRFIPDTSDGAAPSP